MRRALPLLLMASALMGQTPAPVPVQVTVKLNAVQLVWNFVLRIPLKMTSLAFTDPSNTMPPVPQTSFLDQGGIASIGTITFNEPTGPGVIHVQVTVPSGSGLVLAQDPAAPSGVLLLAGTGDLQVPPGLTSVTFLITYPQPVALVAVPTSVGMAGAREFFVDFVTER